jgi:hypothetical protein
MQTLPAAGEEPLRIVARGAAPAVVYNAAQNCRV